MLLNLLTELRQQIRLPDEVIVVDNASQDGTESLVRTRHPEVIYTRLAENLGSAGGYYAGIKRAAESSDFIYTLDDDVCLWPTTLASIVDGYYRLAGSLTTKIGAVRSVWKGYPGDSPTELEICPWRGTLFKTSAVREAGPPSPDFFLYGEDLEYSLRLKKIGYRFYWIPASICQEGRRPRDGKSRTSLLGKTHVRYQEPFRLYYAFRNEVYIWITYKRLLKLLHTFMYAGKVLLMILLTEGVAGRKAAAAVMTGIVDGLRGRLGKERRYTPTGDHG